MDPERLGITGGSAGAHLALMQGTAGKARVKAVACFFPPTDFLNYGRPGNVNLGTGLLSPFKAAFEFKERDARSGRLVPVPAPERVLEIARSVSPAQRVTERAAPALIIHGDADKLVPIQQSFLMVAKLKEAGVPARLIVKRKAGHGWKGFDSDMKLIADWFDLYLGRRS